jgi:toxin-antitoxin system PIN domain toxin
MTPSRSPARSGRSTATPPEPSTGSREGEATGARFLLDVNVVLPLLDPRHVFHEAAHAWAREYHDAQWFTTPLVQHAVMRVASQPRYPNSLGTVGAVRQVLMGFVSTARHRLLADDVALTNEALVRNDALLTPASVTDVHLLALAVKHGLQLATFDRRIPATAIVGGEQALHLIDAKR